MYTLMIVVFVIGYLAIALEHNIHIDKAATALFTGAMCWTIYVIGMHDIVDPASIPAHLMGHDTHESVLHYVTHHQLLEHVSEIAGILFFLMGAMTIVELIDSHGGFDVITSKIKTTKKVPLLWIVSLLTFFLSAALDNLTTSIVMVSLLRKLIADKNDRWFYAGVVIIAANAGGAWSPIGDVTTTMLWIGGQITAQTIVVRLILPSLICLAAPLIYLSFRMKGEVHRPDNEPENHEHGSKVSEGEKNAILYLGLGGLLFVPIFKTLTHLPPFVGMLMSLSVLWIVTELMHSKKDSDVKKQLTVVSVIKKIDMASVLFFLGILLAVGSLQSAGQLRELAMGLDQSVGTSTKTGVYIIGTLIGLLSSIVDNVPLVAASMGMYEIIPQGFFSVDGLFWIFLAYTAGTGGSILIIGSAAGVAVMGIEKIDFIWYLRKMSLLALLGYLAGAGVYILQRAYIVERFIVN
ncbi:sodium:proton antiporter [bacterium]|nr:sodium:proton antiporter [bacterium]